MSLTISFYGVSGNFVRVVQNSYDIEGQPNIVPENISLRHKGSFELIIFEKQHTQEKL